MNLYLIFQDDVSGWDTYDSAVVAAPDEQSARNIHPSQYTTFGQGSSSWTEDPNKVDVQLLGTAIEGTQRGVICASFNAG